MKKSSTKAIEKELEDIKKNVEKISKRIEIAFETLQANSFRITNKDNYITTIRSILNGLEDSSDQLRTLQLAISVSN